MIAGLLLAAGRARRFGAAKLARPLRGTPVVRWSAEALRAGGVDEVVVMVPANDTAVSAALGGVAVRLVGNPEPDRGIGHSIALGIVALPPHAEAVVVALADEPGLRPEWVREVIARRRPGGPAIVAPTFRGVRGHPVLFDRRVFPELAALDGDRGARAVVDRDPGRVAFVEMGTPPLRDVDTPEDLARLEEDAQFTAPRPPRHP